jgi:hypothetical protein
MTKNEFDRALLRSPPRQWWSRLDAKDQDALERSLAIARKLPHREDYFAGKIRSEGKLMAAIVASGLCQDRALGWPPHKAPPMEVAPCEVEVVLAAPDVGGHPQFYDAALLLKKMLFAGVSRFEPDPEAALNR